jgi:hypothetical protein
MSYIPTLFPSVCRAVIRFSTTHSTILAKRAKLGPISTTAIPIQQPKRQLSTQHNRPIKQYKNIRSNSQNIKYEQSQLKSTLQSLPQRQSIRTMQSIKKSTPDNTNPHHIPETSALSTPPPPPLSSPLAPKVKGPSLYNKVDDMLVGTSEIAKARIKRKIPRWKIFFLFIALTGVYIGLKNTVHKESVKYIKSNVINIRPSQARSLSEIASLSREDIFHIFQTLYPEMTSNGMFETERLSYAISDEIDDGYDDRQLEYRDTVKLQNLFLHDSELFFAKEDLKLNQTALENLTQIFLPDIVYYLQKIQNETHIPSMPSLDEVLQPTNDIKTSLLASLDELANQQRTLFTSTDLSSEQRQVQIGETQSQLIHLQNQLSSLEEQQHNIRQDYQHNLKNSNNYDPIYQFVQDHQDYLINYVDNYEQNHPGKRVELLQSYINRVDNKSPECLNQIEQFKQHYNSVIHLMKQTTQLEVNRQNSFEELSPELQQRVTNYLNLCNNSSRFNPELKSQQSSSSSSSSSTTSTTTTQNADSQLIPVSEDFYLRSYYPDVLEPQYPISPWTYAIMFKNLPTGTAGDDRYVKFHDALVAFALLAKTKWSPADPHYKYYLPPAISRQYHLNMDKAFGDYLDDPMCFGGIVSFNDLNIPTHLSPDAITTPNAVTSTAAVEPSIVDTITNGIGAFFTIPKGISNLYRSTEKLQKEQEEDLRHLYYKKIHFEALSKDSSSPPKSVKFEPIYNKPIDDQIDIIGKLFQRYDPECNWDLVPIETKQHIARRFQHLRLRKISQTASKYDYNPMQPLSLAWISMFAPDPLTDTPQARNQYRHNLGNTKQQFDKVKMALDGAQEQPITRVQFEKLLKTMCNAGHFYPTALLTQTNNIWPLGYHLTSPKVIAQAYYDVLDKEPDDSITLQEFHEAASHWGKVGRYHLWYYQPDYLGEGDKITFFDKFKAKWGDRLVRVLHTYVGIPHKLNTIITNTKNGKLNTAHLDLQKVLSSGTTDSNKLINDLFIDKNHLNLSQFAAHSRNVNLFGDKNNESKLLKSGDNKKDDKIVDKKAKESSTTTKATTEPNTVVVVEVTTTVVSTVEGDIQEIETPIETTITTTTATEDDAASVPASTEGSVVAPKKKKRNKKEKKNVESPSSTAESVAVAHVTVEQTSSVDAV